jgi:ABC-type sugar transport system ATPase subunit
MESENEIKQHSVTALEARDVLIQATAMRKAYGSVVAVEEAQIRVRAGEIVALVGDNGAGKSTLVRMLTGVVRPDRGLIEFLGQPVSFSDPLEARLAGLETVHQDLGLVSKLDVTANLFLGREQTWLRLGLLSPLKLGTMRAEARRRIDRTGAHIADIDAQIAGLSGGQRQCVAIARAVGGGASCIVLDEPTAALGVQETEQVELIIRSLRDQGVGCLIVSHNLRQVLRLADTVYVMRRGKTVGSAHAGDLSEEKIVAMITGLAGADPGRG